VLALIDAPKAILNVVISGDDAAEYTVLGALDSDEGYARPSSTFWLGSQWFSTNPTSFVDCAGFRHLLNLLRGGGRLRAALRTRDHECLICRQNVSILLLGGQEAAGRPSIYRIF
jgi:LSD1 subclass zinc finger protein